MINNVWEDWDDVFLITFNEKLGEVTINFQYKDILRGIFYTQDENGNLTGFNTAYFEVTGIINETQFDSILLNGIAPELTQKVCENSGEISKTMISVHFLITLSNSF